MGDGAQQVRFRPKALEVVDSLVDQHLRLTAGARFESMAFKSVAMFDLTDAGRAYLAEAAP